MVDVFKTNVQTKREACKILTQLSIQYPTALMNFDLDDCDKILRIEGKNIKLDKIIQLFRMNGYYCETLE